MISIVKYNSKRDILYFIITGKVFKRYIHNNIIPTRYYVSKDGEVYSDISKRILKPNHTLKGYLKVGIFLEGESKAIPVTVHKMVGLTFHKDQYHEGYDIDHINGIKDDNRAENLEWVTRSENIQRAFKTGLKRARRGDDNSGTVYSDSDIHKACKYLEDGLSIVEVSKLVNIPLSYLYTIMRGESRTDIVSQYHFKKPYKISHTKVTDKMKKKILKLRALGLTAKEIQSKFKEKITTNQIYNVFYQKEIWN